MDFAKLKEQLRPLAILEDVVVEDTPVVEAELEEGAADLDAQSVPEPQQLPA